MACPLAFERVWVDKCQYNDAEKKHYEQLSGLLKENSTNKPTSAQSSAEIEPQEAVAPTSNQKKPKKEKNNKNKKAKVAEGAAAAAAAAEPKSPAAVVELPKVSAQSNPEPVAATPSESQPLSKTKKQKQKKDKKKKEAAQNRPEEDSSVSEDLSVQQKPAVAVAIEPTDSNKAKPGKDNKSKKDKKKAAAAMAAADDKPTADAVTKEKKVVGAGECTLISEIVKARQQIRDSLDRIDDIAALASPGTDVLDRIATLEKENASLRNLVDELKKISLRSEERIQSLESRLGGASAKPTAAPAAAAAAPAGDDDDDVDLFGSDEEDDAEAERVKAERVAAYAAKKSKKPALIAKSNVILDVKPWDDETNMAELEKGVRSISCDGLLFGAAKLVPVAFGVKKLQISCVIEDDKVSVDWLTEEIEKNEDFVQSVDIAAFNKI